MLVCGIGWLLVSELVHLNGGLAPPPIASHLGEKRERRKTAREEKRRERGCARRVIFSIHVRRSKYSR